MWSQIVKQSKSGVLFSSGCFFSSLVISFGGKVETSKRRVLRSRYTVFWLKLILNDGDPYIKIVGISSIFFCCMTLVVYLGRGSFHPVR